MHTCTKKYEFAYATSKNYSTKQADAVTPVHCQPLLVVDLPDSLMDNGQCKSTQSQVSKCVYAR